MRRHSSICIAIWLSAGFVLLACASTKVTDREQLVTEKIPRPGHIWVYPFAATPSEVQPESGLADEQVDHDTPQTEQQISEGRLLGGRIATHLIEEIRKLGLPAALAKDGGTVVPRVDDLVIRGYLLTIVEGSGVKRVMIGFGAGASQLTAAVEGFQMTSTGLRKLGQGKVSAGGGKMPGAVLPVAVLLATANPVGLIVGTGVKAYGELSGKSKLEGRADAIAEEIMSVLEQRFEEEGWID